MAMLKIIINNITMERKKLKKVFEYLPNSNFGLSNRIKIDNLVPIKGFNETAILKGNNENCISFGCCQIVDCHNKKMELISNNQITDETVIIDDIFPNRQIAIIVDTIKNQLFGLAPIFDEGEEEKLNEFISFLREYYFSLPNDNKWPIGGHLHNMERLVKWLYNHNKKSTK